VDRELLDLFLDSLAQFLKLGGRDFGDVNFLIGFC
jgi:hypothetical protein